MLNSFSFAAKTRCFELLQTFPTSGGRAATLFEIKNDMFVAFVSYGNRSVEYKAKLLVYVLQNNTFKLNQTLDTLGNTDVEYFTTHGEHFLAVVNVLDGKSAKQGFVLYRLEAGAFKEIQHIPIYNVQDIHYFTINMRIFMTVSETFSNQVSIFEWKNEKFDNKTQNIAINHPFKCSIFTINNITYIACGSLVDFNATTVLICSGNKFQLFQNLPSTYVLGCPHSFETNGIPYLAIPNYKPSHAGQTAI